VIFFLQQLKGLSTLLYFVRDALNYDRDWNINRMHNNLSINVVNQVLSLPSSSNVDKAGNLGWGGSNTYKFAVHSACRLQTRNIQTLEDASEGG